jgi:hypothetical protein
MINICPFEKRHKKAWDGLVSSATNGNFMFKRDYMDYHSDRFIDQSYMVFKKKQLIAVLPGCKQDVLWNSHGGLTFGGLMLESKNNRITLICEIYKDFFNILKKDGFVSALIKPLPWIYHTSPCEGEIYALSLFETLEQHTEVTTTVDLRSQPLVSTLRKRQKKKAVKSGLTVHKDNDFASFWVILSMRLESQYRHVPVHSLPEITKLALTFPNHISLYRVLDQDQHCVGGSVIFSTDTLWHAQYISANEVGMKSGALDLLFMYLIDAAKNESKFYFDFGISTEKNGKVLNNPLALFKEGFGGRSVIHRKIRVNL